MQISGVSASQLYSPISQPMTSRSEEGGEVASGPAEEAREKGSIAKSAEQAQGIGTRVDLLA